MKIDSKIIIPGIGVGPMTDIYEIKILVCYLLNTIKAPFSRTQMNEVFESGSLVNYFSFCEAVKALLESGHISAVQTEFDIVYTLNRHGVETSERLSNSLPRSLRDNVVGAAMKLMAQLKKERENEVVIYEYANGYNVECIIHDVGFDLMRLTIYAPDMLQAEKIKGKFLSDPSSVYRLFIDHLLSL